ncbi:MAG: hypothetical protein U5N58_01005 [Actinomycetota bacterium]|nr:hypothetical protein [Actinomycetota bacterium]
MMIPDKVKDFIPSQFDKVVLGKANGQDFFSKEITGDEYKERVKRTQKKIADEGYEALLVFGDCYRMSNIRWLVDYSNN